MLLHELLSQITIDAGSDVPAVDKRSASRSSYEACRRAGSETTMGSFPA
jgi:hypothetical protein